ncbi:unnamed protein product [Heligmosomoides polygyrus]|uniref:SLC12 domain-containing protein n=1 Tax=Heligmosomoides polygyrus TaxID=6339 RepID=A0A183GTD6_HELPZ|nr:unnamed protein product [Heligmosomoides polygyrus]
MICGYVVPYNPSDRVYSVMRKLERQLSEWLRKRRVKAFYAAVANASLRAGSQSLLQVCGLGKLRPNIILIGFKTNWHRGGPTAQTLAELNEYFGTIQDAFDSNMAMCVLRNGDMGLDFSEAMKLLNVGETKKLDINLDEKEGLESPSRPSADSSETKLHQEDSSNGNEREKTDHDDKAESDYGLSDGNVGFRSTLLHKDSARSMERFAKLNHHYIAASNTLTENFGFDDLEDENGESGAEDADDSEKQEPKDVSDNDAELGTAQLNEDSRSRNTHTFSLRKRSTRRPTTEQKALIASIARFQRKIKKGVIDVWWLYDDGGLTLLIPHLLTVPKSYLEGAKLRVFTISTSSRTMEQEQRSMAALLSKFRINFSDVSVISDIGRKPQPDM